MAGYKTKREQITSFIERYVLTGVKNRDLNYYKLVEGLAIETGSSSSMVEDILRGFIKSGKLKEIRVLTIPDKEIDTFLDNLKKMEKERKEADETMQEIENSVKKENFDENARELGVSDSLNTKEEKF